MRRRSRCLKRYVLDKRYWLLLWKFPFIERRTVLRKANNIIKILHDSGRFDLTISVALGCPHFDSVSNTQKFILGHLDEKILKSICFTWFYSYDFFHFVLALWSILGRQRPARNKSWCRKSPSKLASQATNGRRRQKRVLKMPGRIQQTSKGTSHEADPGSS